MRELLMLSLGGLLGWLGRFYADRLQRREQFDHQLRLEKEYQIYSGLWESLFEFRRAAHGMVDPLQDGTEDDPRQEFVSAFNSFQSVVRRNEPFIVPEVFEPSRAIVSQGWTIVSASEQLRSLAEYRDRLRDSETDERAAEKMFEEDDSQEKAVGEIDELFSQVRDAIRRRITVTPASFSWRKTANSNSTKK